MNTQIYQIFDRIIKCILLSSAKAVILFINGLFNTNHPVDSAITYNLTEQLDDDLSKRLADNIITLSRIFSYHIEAQTTKDNTISFRVFDYGYHHAASHRGNSHFLNFPQSCVLYLGNNKTVPDEETLTLTFADGSCYIYRIKVFKVLDYSLEELDQMNLVLLTPFLLLQFQKEISKSRTPENISLLQAFILHDIIDIWKKNVEKGVLTELDAIRLYEMTRKLYQHLYAHYEEFQVEGGLNDMIENNFFLETDRMKFEFDRKQQEFDRKKQEFFLETDRMKFEFDRKQQEFDRKKQEFFLETDRMKFEFDRMKQEKETLEKKSVQSIFQFTKDLIQTATALGLSTAQVEKHLNDLKIPYQAV